MEPLPPLPHDEHRPSAPAMESLSDRMRRLTADGGVIPLPGMRPPGSLGGGGGGGDGDASSSYAPPMMRYNGGGDSSERVVDGIDRHRDKPLPLAPDVPSGGVGPGVGGGVDGMGVEAAHQPLAPSTHAPRLNGLSPTAATAAAPGGAGGGGEDALRSPPPPVPYERSDVAPSSSAPAYSPPLPSSTAYSPPLPSTSPEATTYTAPPHSSSTSAGPSSSSPPPPARDGPLERGAGDVDHAAAAAAEDGVHHGPRHHHHSPRGAPGRRDDAEEDEEDDSHLAPAPPPAVVYNERHRLLSSSRHAFTRSYSEHASIVWNGNMLSWGGNAFSQRKSATTSDRLNSVNLSHLQVQRVDTSSSSSSSSCPTGKASHSAVVYRDAMWMYGGVGPDGLAGLKVNSASLYALDLCSFEWRLVSPAGGKPPGKLVGHAAVVYRDRMYIIGGRNWAASSYVYEFDFATSTWAHVPCKGKSPKPRAHHTAVVWRDAAWVYGGSSARKVAHDVYKLSLVDMKWHRVETMGARPPALHHHTAAVYRGSMYIFGGADPIHGGTKRPVGLHHIYALNLQTLVWTAIPVVGDPTPHAGLVGHTAVVHHGCMFVFGGQCRSFIGQMLKLDLSGRTPSPDDPVAATRVTSAPLHALPPSSAAAAASAGAPPPSSAASAAMAHPPPPSPAATGAYYNSPAQHSAAMMGRAGMGPMPPGGYQYAPRSLGGGRGGPMPPPPPSSRHQRRLARRRARDARRGGAAARGGRPPAAAPPRAAVPPEEQTLTMYSYPSGVAGKGKPTLVMGRGVPAGYKGPVKLPPGMSLVPIPEEEEEAEIGEEDGVDDDDLCVICLTRKKCCVCIPCGHISVCITCARELGKGAHQVEVKCPVCRSDVERITKVFL